MFDVRLESGQGVQLETHSTILLSLLPLRIPESVDPNRTQPIHVYLQKSRLCTDMLMYIYTVCIRFCDDPVGPPITRGERSPYYPASTVGDSVTMYCEFIVTNGSARDLNVTWSRIPSSLSNSSGRYTNQTMYSGDNSKANASIHLWHLENIPDIGTYTVRACSKCTCNESQFVLSLHQCNPDVVPQPNETYRRLAIAESSVSGPLPLSVFFVGSSDKLYNSAYWTNEKDENLCLETQNIVAVSCNRTTLANCTFTFNLYLLHPTHESSGNYSVKAISGEDDVSQISTVHLGKLTVSVRVYTCCGFCFQLLQEAPVYTCS